MEEDRVKKKVIKGTGDLKLEKGGDDSKLMPPINKLMGKEGPVPRIADWDTGQQQLKS